MESTKLFTTEKKTDIYWMNYNLSYAYVKNTSNAYNIMLPPFKKIQFDTVLVDIPFGIEDFNNKHILNISISPDTNESHNFICYMKQLDNFFNNILKNIKVPNDFRSKIGNRKYSSFLKENNGKLIVRTHLKQSRGKYVNVMTDESGRSFYDELKNRAGKFTIQVISFWIYAEYYGVILCIMNGVIYNCLN